MKTIKLPEVFNEKEMEFIEEWYSESGMQQLLQARGKEFDLLGEKPPVPGCKFANVKGIQVTVIFRDKSTLMPIRNQELKTVRLLLLNTWIK